MKQQLQNALALCHLIESANNVLTTLQQDLSNYDNPSKEFDKIRLMLDRSFITNNIAKYTAIKNRLEVWYSEKMQRLATKAPVAAPQPNSLYCFAPSNNTGLNEAGILRYAGQSKSGKLHKFEFVNYINKQGAKFNMFFTQNIPSLQKIA